MTSEELDTLERYAKTHNDTAELEVISLARIGLAAEKIRPDEWEYIIKTFESGSDRQWAIGSQLRSVLKLIGGDDGTHK